MIKVLLIDDHALVRASIRQALQNAPDISVIAEASTGTEGVQLAKDVQPQVVLLDLNLPDISGVEVTLRLLRTQANLKILALSAAIDDFMPFRVLDAGAHGYLTKNSSKEKLIDAIKIVNSGGHIISPEIANRLTLAAVDIKNKPAFNSLTHREMEVLMMVIKGEESQAISDKLYLSAKTVHSYRSRIFKKLKIDNDVALTMLALNEGILILDEVNIA